MTCLGERGREVTHIILIHAVLSCLAIKHALAYLVTPGLIAVMGYLVFCINLSACDLKIDTKSHDIDKYFTCNLR